MAYIEDHKPESLAAAIESMHGCAANYVESIAIKESFKGKQSGKVAFTSSTLKDILPLRLHTLGHRQLRGAVNDGSLPFSK